MKAARWVSQVSSFGLVSMVGLMACVVPPGQIPPAGQLPAAPLVQQDCGSPRRPLYSEWPSTAPEGAAAVSFFPMISPHSVGVDSVLGVSDLGNRRIRSASALAGFMQAVRMSSSQFDPVDFSKEEVLAFYSNGGSSSCDVGRLRYLVKTASSLAFYFASAREMNPRETQVCTADFVEAHYQFYRIPRQDASLAIQGGIRGVVEYDQQSLWEVGIRVLEQGSRSRIADSRTLVIRSKEQYLDVMKEHDPEFTEQDLPPVDFRQQMVLALFLGERPNPGYGVKFEEAVLAGKQLKVYYRETYPLKDAIYPAVITQPYASIVLPSMNDVEVQLERVCSDR